MGRGRGFTRSELIVAIVVVVVVAVLLLMFMPSARPGLAKRARQTKDATHIKLIHQAWVVYGREHDGTYPTPSTLATSMGLPDQGAEDFSVNTTDDLYAFCIMQNYFDTEIIISPVEVNEAVTAKTDYNWEAYDPVNGIFWDDTFSMRLDDPTIGANASFAHSSICGDRRRVRWHPNAPANSPVLGTRGPIDGVTIGAAYRRSPTLRFFEPHDEWTGQICFNDNHVAMQDSFYIEGGEDNIFAAEFEHPDGNQAAADAFLGVFIGATEFTVVPVFDPLDPP